MTIFVFYETEPWTALDVQLLDPRFYDQHNLGGDGELVISHDDLTHSVRAFVFPDPRDIGIEPFPGEIDMSVDTG